MGVCGKDEEWQQALYCLKRLRGEGVEQQTITYVAVSHLFLYHKSHKEGSGFTDFGKT